MTQQKVLMTPILLYLLFPFSAFSVSLDSPCADQLQKCGALVEEFERQLQDLKNVAFRSCFTNTACIHEKIAFDDCFAKSLQAIRAPFGENAVFVKNDFLIAAEDYRTEAEQCFSETLETTNGTMADGGEDIPTLARTVFGIELVDRLWGLPNGDLGKEQMMDPQGGCTNKDGGNRVFGGGISRIAPTGTDQLNNLNTTCTLAANELACYRRALDHDPQYRLLMSSRDRTLRSCLQNGRFQSESNCQFGASAQMHSCICNARQELDVRMQSALISCVQHSLVAHLYSALVTLTNGGPNSIADVSTRFKPSSLATTNAPITSLQNNDEQALNLPSIGNNVLTQGSIVGGQCLCACPQKCQLTNFAASNDFSGQITKARQQPVETAAATLVLPDSTQTQQNYRPMAPSMPWYYQPIQTALSAEAGLANGFERFFNGQPPLKKRKKRGQIENDENWKGDNFGR